MARPIRIECSGALYHVTARGDRREAIYDDDEDRAFLAILGRVVTDLNWICHAYCLMSNHYHLVIETPDGNLSKGMRQLNGVFTQYSNRLHGRSGHLFQGRFKRSSSMPTATCWSSHATWCSIRCARMVGDPGKWPWSSYQAMIGTVAALDWLATDGLLAAFATRRSTAIRRVFRLGAELGG